MANYLNRLRKGLKDTVQDAKDAVQREGGLEKLAKKAVVNAGGAAAEIYTHVSNAVTDEHSDPDAAAKKGREYVSGAMDKTSKAAATTRRVTGDVIGTVKDAAGTVRETAATIRADVRETIDDYAGPADRTVKVGTGCYYIDSLSKKEVAGVGAYLTSAYGKIPSGASGRKDVLDFIAANTITGYTQLAEAWDKKGQPAVNALTYLKE
jgi:hypothetical protein